MSSPGTSDEDENNGVTYFIDEEGRYYYQSAGENDEVLVEPPGPAVTVGTSEHDAVVDDRGQSVIVGAQDCQTATLVPSDNGNGDLSYVLVVQEENKQGVDIKNESQEDVYIFGEDNVVEDAAADEELKEDDLPKSAKQVKNFAFSCKFCDYGTHRKYLLLRHLKCHSEERPHKCCICEQGFKTLGSLQNHVNMHNKVKPHICKYCESSFTTSGELIRHVRYKHTHEKPHKCTECDYASVERAKLVRHLRSHTGERPYQCPHCTYASSDTFKLKRHLRKHTGERPYKCEICNMCFTQANSLKSHMLIHNIGEKPVYTCNLCPAKCSRRTDLRFHMQKLHASDKPVECKRCGKSFPDRYTCKVHTKTHEGEKCFKCEVCPYAATTLRQVEAHMLKHTDEKPHLCDQCDQSFRHKQLLRRHHNLYHNPNYKPTPPKEKTHQCNECNMTFARKGNLIRHLAIHDPNSGHHEQMLALKLGRQKKVKMVNGQMKVIQEDQENTEDSEKLELATIDKDMKHREVVTVADGTQYVVLEVIGLDDGTQQVTLMDPDYDQDEEEELEEQHEAEDKKENFKLLENNQVVTRAAARAQKQANQDIKLAKEVETCFGFDEDEQESLESEDINITMSYGK